MGHGVYARVSHNMNGTILDENIIMKNILLLFFLIFGINSSFAECSISGMQFFPKQKEISLNPIFIIQGYLTSQKTIKSFKNRKIYLESENGELIKLNLQEILQGQMNLTQAIFKPSIELKPNTIYYLKYSNQTERETSEMEQWNPEKKEREKVYWKTSSKKFFKPLSQDLNITFEKTEVIYYGCGPAANAIFAVKNKSNSEIWYKTEVVDLSTNKKTTFYIKEWKEKLNVGHGMCSGAFTFSRKGEYKVRFTPMNIDGKSLKTTDWKTFESPFMNAKNPFGR